MLSVQNGRETLTKKKNLKRTIDQKRCRNKLLNEIQVTLIHFLRRRSEVPSL